MATRMGQLTRLPKAVIERGVTDRFPQSGVVCLRFQRGTQTLKIWPGLVVPGLVPGLVVPELVVPELVKLAVAALGRLFFPSAVW